MGTMGTMGSMGTLRTLILLAALAFSLCCVARAEVKTEAHVYKHGETVLEGVLAYDPAAQEKRPGVLVIHDWKGPGEFSTGRAERLAALGYVALAVDIYGQGVRPQTPQEAGKQAGLYKGDRALMRARILAAFETLKKHAKVDGARIGAIGYCFGGTVALELARSGAAVSGVVSFHGGLATPNKEDAKNIKGKVLVLHGADDPHVNAEEVAAFQEEMRQAKVDWQFVAYGNAVHSFTNPKAGNDNSKGAAYNAKAEQRSWEALQAFFAESFRLPAP